MDFTCRIGTSGSVHLSHSDIPSLHLFFQFLLHLFLLPSSSFSLAELVAFAATWLLSSSILSSRAAISSSMVSNSRCSLKLNFNFFSRFFHAFFVLHSFISPETAVSPEALLIPCGSDSRSSRLRTGGSRRLLQKKRYGSPYGPGNSGHGIR